MMTRYAPAWWGGRTDANGRRETATVAFAFGEKPDLIFGRAVVALVERVELGLCMRPLIWRAKPESG
jgi:hypothetical protein